MLPSRYEPLTPDDFIGDGRRVALELDTVVKQSIAAGCAPVTVLFNGEPGIGKSAIAKFLIRLLGVDIKWGVKKYSGTDVDIECVRGLARDFAYRDMFGTYRVAWIEEADAIPAAAQTRFLMLLDDLPPGCSVICTSNCRIDDFKKRFQTRFKIYEMDPPTPQEIETLLRKFLSNPADILQIATLSCGCVRSALLDAERSLQASSLPVAA